MAQIEHFAYMLVVYVLFNVFFFELYALTYNVLQIISVYTVFKQREQFVS